MTEDRVETTKVEGAFMPRLLTHGDRVSWLDVIWEGLWGFREDCIPEGDPMYDEQWDNICTAMAWIAEEIGVNEKDLA